MNEDVLAFSAVIAVFITVLFSLSMDVAPQDLMTECELNDRYEACGWIALPMTQVVKILKQKEKK